MKKVLLAPLDPVHDNAVKLIKRKLIEVGYEAESMPPGTKEEEVVERALAFHPDAILVSRTLGYKIAETLGRLVDLVEAAGLRSNTRLGVGGMALTREIGAELGFDASFTGDLDMRAVIAFIEGRSIAIESESSTFIETPKPDITAGYSYSFKDKHIEALLERITTQILEWTKGKTSAGIERARLRSEMLESGVDILSPRTRLEQILVKRYLSFCDEDIQAYYQKGALPSGVRAIDPGEVERFQTQFLNSTEAHVSLRNGGEKPLIFIQYGTGCPMMDTLHIQTSQAWGADGVLHFDPSWGAQREGLLEGLLSHQHDGTILTLENLKFIKNSISPSTLWNVRGHRGLNTPETQVLGHAAGADLLKINIPYGATGGGTDPARLTVDGIYSLRLAAEYGLPFDIPGNDELSGVPPHKTFAGILIMLALGLKLGARPIPKPLMCYSPYMQINGLMEENMVDMNRAKLLIWREIVDTPVWPGEPVGFMTHTPERVQSSVTTTAHAALAVSLGMDALTMASSDEAYSKGPISAQARVDTLRGVREMLRFMGNASFAPTPKSQVFQAQIHAGITKTLETIAARKDFVASIYEGLLGNPEDGSYPGRTGKDTVRGES
jgi:methylmalonyl-CoA mutase cobalamin-binding subunit